MKAHRPDQAAQLRAAMQGTRPRPYTIAVTSGKGGVGKTNLAVNLAICLARRGRRVVLVDADLGLANADVLLNVEARFNLSHVLSGARRLSEIAIPAAPGVQLLVGASGLAEVADLSEFQRHGLIEALGELEGLGDVIIVDCGAGISRNVLMFAAAADRVLVVTTPDPTALTDAYAVVKVLTRETDEPRIGAVVNQVSSQREGAQIGARLREVAQRFLGVQLELPGCVVWDEMLARAVRQRRALVVSYPDAPAARCVHRLADAVLSAPASGVRPGGFFRRVAGLFG